MIGSNVGVSKQDFLGRAVAYAGIKNALLMPINAVFFQKVSFKGFILDIFMKLNGFNHDHLVSDKQIIRVILN